MIINQWNVLCKNNKGNIINNILEARGIQDKQRFLNPSEKDYIDESLLSNIHKAYEVVKSGIDEDKIFAILYDV